MNETKTLARWVAETPFESIPSEVIEATRIYILDNLASGFAGAHTPWAAMVASVVQEGSRGECSAFGQAWRAAPSGAALFNGVAIGGFETDHPFTAGSCHPSAAVFPAVMAATERSGGDGRTFLAATTLGYEALCRVGAAATRAVEDERGFHGPGTNAPFGGAFGAGRALGLPAETLVQAAGIAGSHGGGLLEFFREGAMTKRLHIGRGSQLGLESVLLAQKGFTGPSTVLEGEHGFLHVYSPSPRPELLVEELGEKWLMLEMALKAYPCHISIHAVVEAITRFKQKRDFEPATLEVLEVRSIARMMEERFAERVPTTLMGAQYSLPWSTAHAIFNDAADPRTWNEEALGDVKVNRLAAAMTLREEMPSEEAAVAQVILSLDGERHVLDAIDWKGAPTNPCTFEDAVAKLRRYADRVVPARQVEEIIERVAGLEALEDAGELVRLVRA